MNEKSIADIHNHSCFSDGEYTPTHLVAEAAKINLQAVGLTDHDTIDGLQEALEAGAKYKIEVISGIEVSVRFQRLFFTGTLHILLYFSSKLLKNITFQNDIKNIIGKGRGEELTKQRVNAINREFGPDGKTPYLFRKLLAPEILELGSNISRRHFSNVLEQHFKITDKKKITMIIGNESPAYLPSGIELESLIQFVKKYPVVTVLAHPAAGSFPEESHYKEVHPAFAIVEQFIPEFINPKALGLDGLEIYYPAHTKKFQNILLNLADRYNLITTGGSDCHDSLNRPIGIAGIDVDDFYILKNKIASKEL